MSTRRRVTAAHRAHAVRVAAAAAGVVALVAVALGAALDVVVSHRLTTQVSEQVNRRLSQAVGDFASRPRLRDSPALFASGDEGGRYGLGIYGAPVFLWEVGAGGHVLRATPGAPELPARAWDSKRRQGGLTIGITPFLVASAPVGGTGWLVTGESLAELSHVRSVLITSEGLALPILAAVVFLGSLAIGIRSVVPVEEARRRQLEFTADASHELRTPLSVIEAELALAGADGALSLNGAQADAEAGARSVGDSPGGAPAGAELEGSQVLSRIGHESARLRRIVDDLLWLARFDAEPAPPGDEPIDLAAIAEACADRFSPLAASRHVTIQLDLPEDAGVRIVAPPEWVDRLAGVLVDNACRYAGEGGCVAVSVTSAGQRAVLAVEDTGPGLPPEGRDRLFDRFRRASDEPGGHGLGLAIADSVVRSTGGRWRIGTGALGGARMEVSWVLA